MKREYNINPSEWDLIFHAPLTENYNELVHNVVGVNNSTSPQFDADKGLYIKASNGGQYGVKFVMPQSFSDAVYTMTDIRLLIEVTAINQHSGWNGSPFRMDNTSSDTDTNNPVIVSQATNGVFAPNKLNLPTNTQIKIWEDTTYDFTNLSQPKFSTKVITDYNDREWSLSQNLDRNYYKVRPQSCPYVRVSHCMRTNQINPFDGWMKDIKVYRHR